MDDAIDTLEQSIRRWDEANNLLYTYIPKPIIEDIMAAHGHSLRAIKKGRMYGVYVVHEGCKTISLHVEHDALLIIEHKNNAYKVKKCCTWLSDKTMVKTEAIIDEEAKNNLVRHAVSYALSYCFAQKLSPEDIFFQLPTLVDFLTVS